MTADLPLLALSLLALRLSVAAYGALAVTVAVSDTSSAGTTSRTSAVARFSAASLALA